MTPIRSKSILIKRKYLDSWFISRAGMNLYRGCSHNCIYCDGRSENYRVEGDFGRDAVYKENAVEILSRELDPRRRRKTFNPGNIFLGGGISDSWQPGEKKLELTRRVLELFKVFPYPLLLLTKSSLILRDLSLLKFLNTQSRVTVAVSISTADEKLSAILEPGASSPTERLEVVRRAKSAGLGAGVMLLPVIPLVTDRPELLDAVYRVSRDAGADFVVCGPMTMKPGRQMDYFLRKAHPHFAEAVSAYGTVYGAVPDRWGNPSETYFEYFGPLVHEIALRYRIPRRIPANLFPDNLTASERAAVILDQMDGLLRERGLNSNFGRASRSLNQMDIPLESPDGWKHLRRLGGVGPSTERIIKEVLDTGSSPAYERVLAGGNLSHPV